MLKCLLFVVSVQIIICDKSEFKNASHLAAEHLSRILKSAKCDKPVPRVVYLSKLFPKVNKKYIPFATILSFCDSSAGCCSDETQRCAPKIVKPLTLHFLVLELTAEGNRKTVESINFNNHSQCHCKHINSNDKFEILEDISNQPNISYISSANHLELEDKQINSSNIPCSNIFLIILVFVFRIAGQFKNYFQLS